MSDAHGEKDSLPSGVAGAQIRHEIPSAFVAKACYRLPFCSARSALLNGARSDLTFALSGSVNGSAFAEATGGQVNRYIVKVREVRRGKLQ